MACRKLGAQIRNTFRGGGDNFSLRKSKFHIPTNFFLKKGKGLLAQASLFWSTWNFTGPFFDFIGTMELEEKSKSK